MLGVVVRTMTVQGWTDTEKELESVAEVIAVVAIESVGAVVDGELGAETDVDTIAVRQVADAAKRIPGHRKDARVRCLIEDQFVPGFLHVLPSKIDRVAA